MTAWMSRSLAAALFAVCVALATLPGCGGPPPKAEKKDEKKEDPKLNIGGPTPPDTPVPPNPAPTPTPGPVAPPKSTLGDVEEAAEKAGTAFLSSLVQGTPTADALSSAFVKVVGKPVVLPSDKAKGYSADAATDWLKRAGDGVNFGLATQRPKQSGDVVYMRGTITGARLAKSASKTGGYSLRLVKEGGAWKVDWLSLSSTDIAGSTTTPTPEGVAQDFAAVSFIETITDLDGMPKDDRAPLIAAAMTPALRAAWGPPFDQDKNQGYDYSPAKINTEATKIGGGTTAFTSSRVGDLPEFKVELTKPTGKKAYVVRLIKGPGANEWLVNEVIEAK